jgi:HEAT repeat protein
MIEVALAVAGAVAAAVWILQQVRQGQELLSAWRSAAVEAGVQVMEEKTWGPVGLIGMAGEHRVLIDEIPNKQASGTRIVIEGNSGITLSPLAADVGKTIERREIELGDEAFDGEVYVRGSPEVVRALFDAALREQLRQLLRGWVRVDAPGIHGLEGTISLREGDLHAVFRRQWNDMLRTSLPEVLAVLLAVARKLEKPDDVVARIAENTRSEPEWRVRRESVRMLAERYPDHPVTRESLQRGCQDENEEVRLRAALGLKDEGRATLLEIATRQDADDGRAATAIAALGEHLPDAAALSVLDDALRRKQTGTVHACLALLGRRGGPTAVERLARVLVEEAPDLAVAAALALGATGSPAAEAPLLQALKDLPAVSTAAAEALGRVGSARAVLPLQEAAAHTEAPGPLQHAVRQAIAEIQSRLPGASPGQVSLAEGDAGQLSLAEEDASGRVSLSKPNVGGAR